MGAAVERILTVLAQHNVSQGVMASPNHWAWRDSRADPGAPRWFAHCVDDGWLDGHAKGCGWDSEPHLYATRAEAHEAALAHLAEQIEAVL